MQVLALVDRYVSGWPENDDERCGLAEIEEVLTGTFDTDVHFTAYRCRVERRHTASGTLTRADEAGVEMVAAVFDVDGPGHEATEEWWEDQRCLLLEIPPGAFIYRTSGGYRIVYALAEPVPIRTADDAEAWTRRYVAWCRHLERFGVSPDRACKSWTRLFRAPHTMREGVLQELETIGNPRALGVWAPELTEEDYEDEAPAAPAAGTLAPKGTAPVAALLGAAWPERGRHSAQLALAGALRRDGWKPEAALEFLCDVCRAAGDEDRPKREKTIAATWAAKGNYTGWTALEGHVGKVVVQSAQRMLDPNAEAMAEFLEAVGKAPEPEAEPIDNSGIRWGGWDALQEPPIYLIEGLIPENKVVTFFAEGGSVKTWSALALAIAVASGEPWLDSYQVKAGKALYLDYEDGPYEFHRRVRYLTGGEDVPNLGYRYGGAQIDNEKFWLNLTQYVTDKGIALVVIDSISASMPGDADENASAFAQGLKYAGRFTECGCTIIFVHHANKSGGIRGFSGIRDQSDICFKFEPVSENDDGVKRMRMVCDKPGPQKKPAPVNVELNDNGLTTFEDEAYEAGGNAFSSVDVCAAVRLALANGPVSSMLKLREMVRRKKGEVEKAVKELIAEGEVVKLGTGYAPDSEGLRTQRVLDLLDSGLAIATAGEIARHAFVDTRFVDRLRLSGIIFLNGDGTWKKVQR